jgi:hypothetical protein
MKRVFSRNGVKTIRYLYAKIKKESRHKYYILHKNWLEMDHVPKYKNVNL